LKDVFGEGKRILNSLPLAVALCIVKVEQPSKQLEFAKLLLSAVYYDGLNSIDLDGIK